MVRSHDQQDQDLSLTQAGTCVFLIRIAKDFGNNVLVMEPNDFLPQADEPPKVLVNWRLVLARVPSLLQGVIGDDMPGWTKGVGGRVGDGNDVCSLFLPETSIMSQDWTTDMRLISAR